MKPEIILASGYVPFKREWDKMWRKKIDGISLKQVNSRQHTCTRQVQGHWCREWYISSTYRLNYSDKHRYLCTQDIMGPSFFPRRVCTALWWDSVTVLQRWGLAWVGLTSLFWWLGTWRERKFKDLKWYSIDQTWDLNWDSVLKSQDSQDLQFLNDFVAKSMDAFELIKIYSILKTKN